MITFAIENQGQTYGTDQNYLVVSVDTILSYYSGF